MRRKRERNFISIALDQDVPFLVLCTRARTFQLTPYSRNEPYMMSIRFARSSSAYSHRSVYKRENIQLRLFIYIHRIHPNLYIKYIVRRAKVRNDRFDKRK